MSLDKFDHAALQKSWKYIRDLNSVSRERLDQTALVSMNRSYTYRQMFRNWDRYAEVFSALGITGENHARLAVFDCGCVESSFAFYAANMTGASAAGYAPGYLSEKFPLDRAIKTEGITDLLINDVVINEKLLTHVLKLRKELGLRNIIVVRVPLDGDGMDPQLVKMSRQNYRRLKKMPGVAFMDDLMSAYEATPIRYGKEENDPQAFILHTSGTTKGISKPVPLSDYAVNIAAESMKQCPEFEQFKVGTVSLCTMVATSVYGFVNQLHGPLSFGCEVVVPPMSNTNPCFVKMISDYKVNVLFITPYYFEAWSKMPEELVPDFSTVNCVITGGAYLSAKARKRYMAFINAHGGNDPMFINGYGMSETCGACIIQTGDVEDDSIGFALPGVNIRIYDELEEKFYAVEDRHTGVLYINSDSISMGKIDDTTYFELEEIDGLPYICTNDVVQVNEDGSLACKGRANRYFVNNDGIKFNAGLIENLVAAQDGIEACAMVPWYDKILTHDTVPVLYVQTLERNQNDVETVRKALVEVFIGQKKAEETNLPMQCVITGQIPRNDNGKVDIYRITTGKVEGARHIIRPIRKDGVLQDIRLEFVPASNKSIMNGAVPEELEQVWKDIRMSVRDETVVNQAANSLSAKMMGPMANPFIAQQMEILKQTMDVLQNIHQQMVQAGAQIMQSAMSQYNGMLSGMTGAGGGAQFPYMGQPQPTSLAPQLPYMGQPQQMAQAPQFPFMTAYMPWGMAPAAPNAEAQEPEEHPEREEDDE